MKYWMQLPMSNTIYKPAIGLIAVAAVVLLPWWITLIVAGVVVARYRGNVWFGRRHT